MTQVTSSSLPIGVRGGIPGVDYAWSKPSIGALEGAGEVFVAQYDSRDVNKNLTPARADQLLAANIKIVLVYEYGAQDMLRGRNGGHIDASHAKTAAQACGIDGIPIYFAADWDATPGQQAAINDYLDGCADILGHSRVGMYGGYWPLSRAKKAGKVSYLWGTPAWSGSEWATSGLVPDIMQGALVTIGGVQCDLDAGLSADYGQWPRPSKGATWQEFKTDGWHSLADVAALCYHMPVSSVLRHTATHYGAFDVVTSDYINKMASDQIASTVPIPTGAKLWVRK